MHSQPIHPARLVRYLLLPALLAGLASTLAGCRHAEPAEPAAAQLPTSPVFASGFEGDVQVLALPARAHALLSPGFEVERLVGGGRQGGVPGDWQRDLAPSAGVHAQVIEYTGGRPEQRFARVIDEPGKPGNKVLHFQLADAWDASEGQRKARIQSSLYGIAPGLKTFRYSVRMYLHPDLRLLERYPHPIGWLTLAEFWNNEWWVKGERHGFRITLGIGKKGAQPQPLNFILNAEDAGPKEIWHADPRTRAVPIGEWITLDCYYHEGDAGAGRFVLTMTPASGIAETVFDVRNFTRNTADPAPDGVTGFNPMKLYTSAALVDYMRRNGRALQVYWDDFKLWTPAGRATR